MRNKINLYVEELFIKEENLQFLILETESIEDNLKIENYLMKANIISEIIDDKYERSMLLMKIGGAYTGGIFAETWYVFDLEFFAKATDFKYLNYMEDEGSNLIRAEMHFHAFDFKNTIKNSIVEIKNPVYEYIVSRCDLKNLLKNNIKSEDIDYCIGLITTRESLDGDWLLILNDEDINFLKSSKDLEAIKDCLLTKKVVGNED